MRYMLFFEIDKIQNMLGSVSVLEKTRIKKND